MPDEIYFGEPSFGGEMPAPSDVLAEQGVVAKEGVEPRNAIWRLIEIQSLLKVEKKNWNSYGKYAFRSKEDILEAAKPLCHERGLAIIPTDRSVVIENGWPYIVTTARLIDAYTQDYVKVGGNVLEVEGWAREPETRKGMDCSQITGTAASYSGKRALGNLFAIDDTSDSDGLPPQDVQRQRKQRPSGPLIAHCTNCNTRYEFPDMAAYTSYVASNPCCDRPNWVVE